MYCAVIGDFIDSKKMEPAERKEAQDRLRRLLERVNSDYGDYIAANFLITLGDEFQGLMFSCSPVLKIIELFEREFYPQKIRFGIGLGDIYTGIDPRQALGADGPAYHLAREAVNELKENREDALAFFPVRFKTQNCDETILNALCVSASVFMSGWTEKQRELVFKTNEFGGQQRFVADVFGKNPSTVARGLKSAHYEQFHILLEAAQDYLRNQYDTDAHKNGREEARCFYNAGLYWTEQYRFKEATANFQKALQFSGESDPITGKIYYNIAKICRLQGDYPKALHFYQSALAFQNGISNKPAPEHALLYNALGLTYLQMGDCATASGCFHKALECGLLLFPDESPNIASIYNNMGVTLIEQGKAERALGLFQKALDIQQKILGNEHPDTASTYDNIGYAYDSLKEEDRASDYFSRALAIRRMVLGKDHLLTASSYNNVGEICRKRGDYRQALDFYGKALEIQEKLLGKVHPAVAGTYNNMGLTFFRMGNKEKALACYEKALALFEQTLGEHKNTRKVRSNLAELYEAQGEAEKALPQRNDSPQT